MELAHYLLPWLNALWWPFCRSLALLSSAPFVGDAVVPLAVRALLALALAVALLPVVTAGPEPFSIAGILATVEQVVIGAVLGLALHVVVSAISVFGAVVSSQIGFSMAQMNDPMNGQPSDVVTQLVVLLAMLVFFGLDGHLVLSSVLGASFRAWPVSDGLALPLLQAVSGAAAWIFSAALLMALPIVCATMVVQLGIGLLNRVAPTLNLFSLGFSVATVFGLFMLAAVLHWLPQHYVALTGRVLELLRLQMGVAHG